MYLRPLLRELAARALPQDANPAANTDGVVPGVVTQYPARNPNLIERRTSKDAAGREALP